MADLQALTAAIERGDRKTATETTRAAIDDGMDPATILAAMTEAMDAVGAKFQRNEIYVPRCSSAPGDEGVGRDPGAAPGGQWDPTAVHGGDRTVKGDLHDIGKNLVAMMWKGANIEVVDLGANVAPEDFVAKAREHDAKLVGVSALLTTTMIGMKDVVDGSERPASPTAG